MLVYVERKIWQSVSYSAKRYIVILISRIWPTCLIILYILLNLKMKGHRQIEIGVIVFHCKGNG